MHQRSFARSALLAATPSLAASQAAAVTIGEPDNSSIHYEITGSVASFPDGSGWTNYSDPHVVASHELPG